MAASQLLIVVIVAIGLMIVAERMRIQSPLLLAAVGLAVSFIPGLPQTTVEPDIILHVVLPPLLYSAALNFSFLSFMRRLRSIFNLGVGLVVVTSAIASLVAGWLVPGLSVPAALILGAVIAPTDAVSATAIGQQLGLPNRVMTILKGESLINDAAALTLFSAAAATAIGAQTFIGNIGLLFLYAVVVGVLIGLVLGVAVHWIRQRLTNPTLATALAFVTPFAAYSLAEQLHGSGVVAVVFAGFSLGYNAASLKFDGRIQERSVWQLVDGLLEAFAFAYIGLQMRFVIQDALNAGVALDRLIGTALAVFAVVTVVRICWIMGTAVVARLLYRWRLNQPPRPDRSPRPARPARAGQPARPDRQPRRRGTPPEPLGWRENLVLSWTGMRGVVTLAAAAGTPLVTELGQPLAGREIIVPVAYLVAIATLLVQGLTLPWLIRVLHIGNDADLKHEEEQYAYAWTIAERARTAAIEKLREAGEVDEELLGRLRSDARRDATPENDPGPDTIKQRRAERLAFPKVAAAIFSSQRTLLITERDDEKIDDEVARELLELLDLEEAVMAIRSELAEPAVLPAPPPPKPERPKRKPRKRPPIPSPPS
ncbi:MAG: cation:proton antiporter [Devosia sp.]